MKLLENTVEKVTKARKDDAMYVLASYTDNLPDMPSSVTWQDDREWQLAEIRKYGTVRSIKDKSTKHTILTTYGRVKGNEGYYGIDANTGEVVDQETAKALYHRSMA